MSHMADAVTMKYLTYPLTMLGVIGIIPMSADNISSIPSAIGVTAMSAAELEALVFLGFQLGAWKVIIVIFSALLVVMLNMKKGFVELVFPIFEEGIIPAIGKIKRYIRQRRRAPKAPPENKN